MDSKSNRAAFNFVTGRGGRNEKFTSITSIDSSKVALTNRTHDQSPPQFGFNTMNTMQSQTSMASGLR